MFIVLFNGPPRSGKDTAAEMLLTHLESRTIRPMRLESLSFPLRKMAYGMADWKGELDGPNYETFKTQRFLPFKGGTGRELMIDASEKFLKQVYGETIMAEMLIDRSWDIVGHGLVIVRDSGFQLEIDPIISAFGSSNTYVVRMHREGCDFASDSREYVNHPLSRNNFDLWNNGSLDDLETEVVRVYGRMVNQLGWVL